MSQKKKKNTKNKNVREYLLKNDVEIVPRKKQGRWSMTAGLCSGNFKNLFLLNMLCVFFFLPTIVLFSYRTNQISVLASAYPFTQNVFNGSPVYPVMKGAIEQISIYADRYLMLGVLAFAVIGSLAVSGLFYLMRNLIWTNGAYKTKDFFVGIKKNYLTVLALSIIYSLVLCGSIYMIGYANYMKAIGGGWLFTAVKVASYVIMFILGMVYLYACTFAVNYKANLWRLIVNGFKLTFTFIVPNVLMLLFSLIPFILLLLINSSFLNMLLLLTVMVIGFVFFSLSWTSYNMYVFEKVVKSKNLYTAQDLAVNEKAKSKKNVKKEAAVDEEYFEEIGNNYSMKGVKPITDEDVSLHELPQTFSRSDLVKLEESKQKMQSDSDEYRQNYAEDKGEGNDE